MLCCVLLTLLNPLVLLHHLYFAVQSLFISLSLSLSLSLSPSPSPPVVISLQDLTIVTASVDRLELLEDAREMWPGVVGGIGLDRNVVLTAEVVWQGKSSMLVGASVAAVDDRRHGVLGGELRPLLRGDFTMVALDKDSQKPTPIRTKLVPETTEEKAEFARGAATKAARVEAARRSLKLHPPTEEELQRIHARWLEMGKKPLDATAGLPFSEARAEHVFVATPQSRNVHGKMFGGSILRMCYELCVMSCRMSNVCCY